MAELRTDFENLKDGDRVRIYPRPDNPLHKSPIKAIYQQGYFYCSGSKPEDGPDYYLGDVRKYNLGFVEEE